MMWKAARTWWKYLGAKAHLRLEETADPKVQLEQAITEARDQHRKLTEQAANVIANQKQAERRLDRVLTEYESTKSSARQALVLVDREWRAGQVEQAGRFEQAATSFAGRLIGLERQVDDLRKLVLDTTQAAEQAKLAVRQNATALQQKLEQREQLLSTLDQAKMHEQMHAAMAQLEASVGDDVPTFAQVQQKIDARLARAQGMAELAGSSIDVQMLEVQRAQADAEAQARLQELADELGLASVRPALVPAPVGHALAVRDVG
ncbi:MAG TPA: PspA/IM30 family protein [Acidimicrobiia bacterium]|jgi:phage shock protein A